MQHAAYLLRHAAFKLNTRRFGSLAEEMIKKLTRHEKSRSRFHDLYDHVGGRRIEIKFSTVMRKSTHLVGGPSIFQALEESLEDNRKIAFDDRASCTWQSNIQQVKCTEFESLYYGLFFADSVLIFHANTEQVKAMPNYSDSQHKGNKGEGQFHLNPKTFDYHFEHHLAMQLSYPELAELMLAK